MIEFKIWLENELEEARAERDDLDFQDAQLQPIPNDGIRIRAAKLRDYIEALKGALATLENYLQSHDGS